MEILNYRSIEIYGVCCSFAKLMVKILMSLSMADGHTSTIDLCRRQLRVTIIALNLCRMLKTEIKTMIYNITRNGTGCETDDDR